MGIMNQLLTSRVAHPPKGRASLRRWIGASIVMLSVCLGGARPAEASHFRYGALSYAPTGSAGQIQFRLISAFRRSGYTGTASDGFAQTGDIITENVGGTSFIFGDGANTPTLQFRVLAFSVTDDFVIGEALNPGTTTSGLTHTYTGAGPFTAGIDDCCRLSSLGNGGDDNYILTTIVTPGSSNRSPISNLVPVVVVPQSANATFQVPAADPDGDTLRYRLATAAESGVTDPLTNISINATTGVVTLDSSGLDSTKLYTVQFIVQDVSAAGVVKSQTPVDVLIRIGNQTGLAPEIEVHTNDPANPHGPLTVTPGTPVVLTVEGFDTDAGAMITLNSSGLPSGATSAPSLPVTGPTGVKSTVSFTPTAAQVGTFVITFSATDNTGLQSLASITIIVANGTPQPSVASINDIRVTEGNSGTRNATFTISLSAASTDPVVVVAQTANGTATAGQDFVGGTANITFRPGQTTRSVSVKINGDTTVEADETFTVNLSLPTQTGTSKRRTRATIGDAQGIGTIVNDDTPPVTGPQNVTASVGLSVSFQGGGPYVPGLYRPGGGALTQRVTIRNTSGAAITGPIYLVLDGLSGATLKGARGTTANVTPVGSPFVVVSTGGLAPNASKTVRLQFNGSRRSVPAFTLRVLAGSGTP